MGEEEPQEEMLMMCDDPSNQHFFKVNNYNQLMELKERLLESLCDGKICFYLQYSAHSILLKIAIPLQNRTSFFIWH